MGPIMAPTGPDVSCSANLGQFGDNLASWRILALNNFEGKCDLSWL